MEFTHTLVNGCPTNIVSAGDRGLLYGDGVFRTLRVAAGRPLWWAEQFAKLASDATRLSISCPPRTDWEVDLAACLDSAASAAKAALAGVDGVLRLTLTRGVGARGYAQSTDLLSTRIVQFFPLPADADQAALGLVHRCHLRLSTQPALAGVKHLNRLEQVLARAEWTDPQIGEGLLFDREDRLISGVGSNLFLLHGMNLSTPNLDRCGVSGVARERLLARAPTLGFSVTVADLGQADLETAEAVFLCNSVRGLRWVSGVSGLDGRSWAQHPAFEPLREALWVD